MLEYLAIKITTPEVEQAVSKYCTHCPEYEDNDYLLYDSKMKSFIVEQSANVEIDLVVLTLEIFEEALLLLGLGLTLNEIKEILLD